MRITKETAVIWAALSREEKGEILLANLEGNMIQVYSKRDREWKDTEAPLFLDNFKYCVRSKSDFVTLYSHRGFTWDCPPNAARHQLSYEVFEGKILEHTLKVRNL